ncbi:hypothetical protein BH20VER1_BH20VER1_02540 [soil metagenome]
MRIGEEVLECAQEQAAKAAAAGICYLQQLAAYKFDEEILGQILCVGNVVAARPETLP